MDPNLTKTKPEQNISVTSSGNKEGEPLSSEHVAASNEIALDKEVRETVRVNDEGVTLTPEQRQAGVEYAPEAMPVSEATGDKVQISISQAQAVVGKNHQEDSLFGRCLVFLRSIKKMNFLKLKKVGS